jgi:hypothetical protein
VHGLPRLPPGVYDDVIVKRRLVRICVFPLLGAIINIAVAREASSAAREASSAALEVSRTARETSRATPGASDTGDKCVGPKWEVLGNAGPASLLLNAT